jgi:ribose 1,5-bisphosphokinase PhnN
VERTEQQARDRDARFILESELRRAQDRVADLATVYNQGRPTPLPSEQGLAERYRERTAELRRRLERAQGDVAAIERELARLPALR